VEISSYEGGCSGYVDAKDTKGSDIERITLPITLGSDEYLLFGDNTSMSWDRRMYGPVSREAIVGQVTRIIFPPWRIQDFITLDSCTGNDASDHLDNSAQKD